MKADWANVALQAGIDKLYVFREYSEDQLKEAGRNIETAIKEIRDSSQIQ